MFFPTNFILAIQLHKHKVLQYLITSWAKYDAISCLFFRGVTQSKLVGVEAIYSEVLMNHFSEVIRQYKARILREH